MKKLYILLFSFFLTSTFFAQTAGVEVFINEIHYDNTGADSGEGVEVAGPAGTDLSTFSLTAYNGNNGAAYGGTPLVLSGMIPDEGSSGYGAVFFAISGLQNGAPDGVALSDGGGNVQFLSYEGAFMATDGPAIGITSTDIGVAETSSTAVGESLQLSGTGNVYTNFIWNAPAASSYNLINPGQTFGAASPSINITAPADATVFNPGTTNVDVEFTASNLVGGETIDITINGSTINNVTSPYSIETVDGMTYNVTVDLVNGGPVDSDMVSFSIGTLTSIADLAAVRADYIANGTGAFYSLQSTPTVTYTRTSRNQKYIQDSSAGILIDDNGGLITTVFAQDDGMSGLTGQVSEFSGVMQFIPIQDASVVAGSPVTPEVITLANILANQEAYESELVQINDITFADGDGVAVFAASTNYSISDPSARAVTTFRSNFSEADYIGQLIPQGPISIATFVGEFNGTPQVTSRTTSDLTLSLEDVDLTGFALYPNPTSTGFVNIKTNSGGLINVAVYNVLGKQVLKQTVSERLNVSSLNAGVYIIRLSQNNSLETKKLIIR